MTENLKRYLITTADERTWKFDRPVIFLGDWCRLYGRRHIWQDMDACVAAPYGLGQTRKDADHIEARNLEEKLFSKLYQVLNEYHSVHYGARFWQIMLGHWIRRYADVMFNRVRTLEQCLQQIQISGTTAYANKSYSLAPNDSYAAVWAFNDDRWNNALYARVLELLEANVLVEMIDDFGEHGFNWEVTTGAPSLKRRFLKLGYEYAGALMSCFARDSDAFILNTYLPKKEEIKLQLALKQCPQLWGPHKFANNVRPDPGLRKRLAKKIVSVSGNKLEDIMTVMLFELLPVCYLEGFSDLNIFVEYQSWPKRPKLIFTSNNFDTDEVFKLWTAKNTELGSTYIVGQHGNYGVSRNHIDPSIEEITADKFLTWGWTDGLPQHTPAFVFKTAGRKKEAYDAKGGVLLIENSVNHRITTWDGTAEFSSYFMNQQCFVSNLSARSSEHLIVRLHAGSRYLEWDEEARWQSFNPELKIDIGSVAIHSLIAQSRLVVHSYDSTGILETLSQNIPTLAFWQDGFDHLRESAKPHYQLLVDAGIFHLTAKSAAEKVNEVWDHVDGWWGSCKIQEARIKFCERYAKSSNTPVRDLMRILQK